MRKLSSVAEISAEGLGNPRIAVSINLPERRQITPEERRQHYVAAYKELAERGKPEVQRLAIAELAKLAAQPLASGVAA